MSVGIIVPCYGCVNTITETLTGIKNQTFSNFHCILIIDGPDIPLKTEIQNTIRGDDRFSIVQLPENRGVAHCRNLGIASLNNDLIAFCDADDIWHQKKLEAQITQMQRMKADAASCNAIRSPTFSGFGNAKKIRSSEVALRSKISKFNPINHSSLLIKRSVIAATKFVQTAHEDYQFLIDISEKYDLKIAHVENPLLFYRTSPNSRSGSLRQSSINSLRLKIRNFGYIRTIIGLPAYVLHTIRKRAEI